ncbi:reverse transcriptase N-terminal domain-containing protein, partial [Vibrio diabolicus]|uniref:reverse transcriptase N-terminal domain-containing protein n=1 Tax=Vibrio diabolicus TaxID=50719 RepID=UPI003D7D2303
KRVSQNKGSKTPGIDGVIWNTDARRMKAVNQLSRRTYKAKPLHLLALEPVSETLADLNSYGFRPNRSTADAISQCFICLAQKK